MRHPVEYFVTRRVQLNYSKITGGDPEKTASLFLIFPRFRASIAVPSAWVSELLSDPRRRDNPDGTFWLGTDGLLLWVMVDGHRLISVISLTEDQTKMARQCYGEAMRRRDAHLERVEKKRTALAKQAALG